MEILREKILVIQTAFIGDAVLTLPLIEQISLKYNNPIIHVLAIPNTKEIFENSNYINKVIVYDKRKKDKGIWGIIKLSKILRNENYTLIISPHRSFRTSILVMLSNVKNSIGFDNASINYVYKKIVKYNINEHEVLRNLRLIDFNTNEKNWRILPKLNFSKEVKEKVNNFLLKNKVSKFICIAPGSVWQTKMYPIEYYIEIAKHFSKKGLKVILLGSKSEYELCDKFITDDSENIINSAGIFSISEVIELISKSSLLICNDSAPTHFGMVSDAKVLTVYCSTIAEFGFYPYNSKSKYLSYDNLTCKPCGIHGRKECPLKTFDCGYKLLPNVIIKQAEELIDVI